MKITSFYFNGTTAVIYVMNKGERIGRHNHENEGVGHTTGVASGRSRVTIYRGNFPTENKWYVLSQFEITPDHPHVELDHRTDHDIEALDDGTVVVHMHKGKREINIIDYVEENGGIMLANGTIHK